MKSIEVYFNEEAKNHDEYFIQKLGMTEFYDEIERVMNACPKKANILVLGCGTGLELERIKFSANVVAIDIADKMIEELKKKQFYKGIKLTAICDSILDFDFGFESYDIVISCYTMHHFNEEQKRNIYLKIYTCLSENGTFIHGDSMEEDYEKEQMRLNEAEKVYKENNLPFASLHIDVPFCLDHEVEVLKSVGFHGIIVEKEWSRTKLYRVVKK